MAKSKKEMKEAIDRHITIYKEQKKQLDKRIKDLEKKKAGL